mmetsp:Transcript_13712/g.31637  ORF Transcript_13712/g.31637 Transcript_13712/m.31637 type:complete len:274 (+) Transcript_13712:2117-2938(+)
MFLWIIFLWHSTSATILSTCPCLIASFRRVNSLIANTLPAWGRAPGVLNSAMAMYTVPNLPMPSTSGAMVVLPSSAVLYVITRFHLNLWLMSCCCRKNRDDCFIPSCCRPLPFFTTFSLGFVGDAIPDTLLSCAAGVPLAAACRNSCAAFARSNTISFPTSSRTRLRNFDCSSLTFSSDVPPTASTSNSSDCSVLGYSGVIEIQIFTSGPSVLSSCARTRSLKLLQFETEPCVPPFPPKRSLTCSNASWYFLATVLSSILLVESSSSESPPLM